jgi:hypothetical protein
VAYHVRYTRPCGQIPVTRGIHSFENHSDVLIAVKKSLLWVYSGTESPTMFCLLNLWSGQCEIIPLLYFPDFFIDINIKTT